MLITNPIAHRPAKGASNCTKLDNKVSPKVPKAVEIAVTVSVAKLTVTPFYNYFEAV